MQPALAPSILGAWTLLAPAFAQEAPAAAQPEFQRVRESLFAADLPTGWRSMTPDEMFGMREELPLTMRDIQPGWFYTIGDVERWEREGFDGHAILVHVQQGEIPVDEASIAHIRENWRDNDAVGGRRSVLDAEIVAVGENAHPAIRCEMSTESWQGMPPIRATELYVPTSGHLLILSFRSWQDDVERHRPLHEKIIESMTFPKPPKATEEVTGRFTQALLIGAGVGLILILLRMSRRR